jgi:glucan biosynthesis protein C
MNNNSSRLYFMDNLRALAMLSGVIFHAAMVYSPLMQNVWFISDQKSSPLIDIFIYFLHMFRMPLFFVISGFFALMLIEKRGALGFFKNRSKRVLMPFLVFFPLLGMAFMMLITWILANTDNPTSLMALLSSAQANDLPLSTMHLWFLFNLYLFVLMTLILDKFNFFNSTLIKRLGKKYLILFVLPLTLIPALASLPTPIPAPDKLYPELWSFGFYGILFILGGILYKNNNLLEAISPYKNHLLLVSFIGYGYFYSQLPSSIVIEDMIAFVEGVPLTFTHILLASIEAIVAVYMTLYCLIVGKQYLNRQSKTFRLIADSSYWVYLLHVPLLLFIQFHLITVDINVWLKLFISSLAAIAFGFVTYIAFVRKTPIGWLLNGKK